MNLPEYLKKGDKIWIVSPAKALPDNGIAVAIETMEKWGLNVAVGEHVYGKSGGFSGTDEERTTDLQKAIDDTEAKAIFMSRGGYGSVRIIENLNFEPLIHHPKWVIGFSDITYFHLMLNQLKIPTIHGTMPLEINFAYERQEAIKQTQNLLFGETKHFKFNGDSKNIEGLLVGDIVGGNLNIIHGNLGNLPKKFWNDKILFVEDICEELYAIDRMLNNMKRAEVFDRVQGFLIGGFTNIKDTNNWFPTRDVNELIFELLNPFKKPIGLGLSAGHIKNNWPIIMGTQAKVVVQFDQTIIEYLNG